MRHEAHPLASLPLASMRRDGVQCFLMVEYAGAEDNLETRGKRRRKEGEKEDESKHALWRKEEEKLQLFWG